MIAFALLLAAVALPHAQPDGGALFSRNCTACHGEGGWGTRRLAARLAPDQPALLAQRRDLDPEYVALVIRQGIGPMPPFRPTDLTAAEVRAIADWLTRGRHP